MAEMVRINEGKTKIIWAVRNSGEAEIESKNDITAFDDPKFTSVMPDKAILSTTTTCGVFELLKAAGLPVAYLRKTSENKFRALYTKMLPLEIVARRLVGPKSSYIQRYPGLAEGRTGTNPYRFHRLKVEFFLKTAKGKVAVDEETVWEGLEPGKDPEDPLITNIFSAVWLLAHPHKPVGTPGYDLKKSIPRSLLLPLEQHIDRALEMVKRSFLVLEGAFGALGFHFPDLKVELGIGPDNQLLISDVLDNDSWRLCDFSWQEYSKQFYRDLIKAHPEGLTGEQMAEVASRYRVVARLTTSFRIPDQALVLWRGSEDDPLPEIPTPYKDLPGVHIEEVVESGHKSPRQSCDRVDELETKYPDGGVIIVNVGRSNAVGPELAARMSWPVISVPKDYEKFPADVHSSVRLPSNVPNLTTWPDSNAIRAAMNFLALKNPAVYAARRMEIEELDL